MSRKALPDSEVRTRSVYRSDADAITDAGERLIVEDMAGGAPPSDPDGLTSFETNLPPGVAPPESWDDFFESREGNAVVHVRRFSPQTWPDPTTGKEVNAEGFCGTVPFGVNVEQYVSERWGGGNYQVSLVVGNRYRKSRKVALPGPPILAAQRLPVYVPNAPGGPGAGHGEHGVEELGETDAAWERRIRRLTAEQAILKTINPPDVNTKLLELFVTLTASIVTRGNSGNSLKEQLETFAALDELRNNGNGAPAGSSMLDVIRAGVDMIPKLAALSNARRPPMPPQPLLSSPSPTPAPATTEADPTFPETEPPAESEPMSYQTMLDRALETIATHYSLPTVTPAVTVAGALAVAFPLPQAIRDRVKEQALELAALGLTLLSDEQLADPRTAGNWPEYVGQVLTSYADPNRPNPLAGLKL